MKGKWVFSIKNWEGVEEEEHVLLAPETEKTENNHFSSGTSFDASISFSLTFYICLWLLLIEYFHEL